MFSHTFIHTNTLHIHTHTKKEQQQDKEDIYAKDNKEMLIDKSRSKRGTHIILSRLRFLHKLMTAKGMFIYSSVKAKKDTRPRVNNNDVHSKSNGQ